MTGHNTRAYYSLIESLVADQQRIWGEQAIDIADSIAGLHVSHDDIWVNGNEKDIAGLLAKSYIEKFGQAAESSLQDTASEYEDEIDLPAVLQS